MLTLMLLYLPFVGMDGGLTRMLDTSRRFVGTWRFNGSIHPLTEAAVAGWLSGDPWQAAQWAKWIADGVCAGLLGIVLVAAMLFHRVPWRASMTYLFALVCLSSTAHPWYLLWALALLPVAWSAGRTIVGPAVWVASLTLAWSYEVYLDTAPGVVLKVSTLGSVAIWLPIYGAVGYGLVKVWRAPPGDAKG